jgi:hypothetical protein
MDDRQADLFADFGLAGADRFNILLIKHNDRALSVGQTCSSWSWARHGRDPEAAAFAAPNAVMAASAACPLPEQQRYECDCEILVGASRVPPRLP